MTHNHLQQVIESSESVRVFVDAAEERGTIAPAEIELFAVEHDLNEIEVEDLMRELERIGVEIAQPPEAAASGSTQAVSPKISFSAWPRASVWDQPVSSSAGAFRCVTRCALSLMITASPEHAKVTSAQRCWKNDFSSVAYLWIMRWTALHKRK